MKISLNEIIGKLNAGYVMAGIVVLLSLIEISPIKLNPWEKILGWLGKKLNGATEKRLESVERQILDMWVNSHRQCILTFAREARAGIDHSSDEWTNVLNVAEEYERHIKDRKLSNGIVTQDTEFIRNLYQELSRDHRI